MRSIILHLTVLVVLVSASALGDETIRQSEKKWRVGLQVVVDDSPAARIYTAAGQSAEVTVHETPFSLTPTVISGSSVRLRIRDSKQQPAGDVAEVTLTLKEEPVSTSTNPRFKVGLFALSEIQP